MKTEKQLQDYFKRQCKKAHIGFYKMECVGQSGFPDVLLAYNGFSVYVELKSPAKTGALRPRQIVMIDKLTKQGLEIYVIDSKEQADAIIAGLIRRRSGRRHRPLI